MTGPPQIGFGALEWRWAGSALSRPLAICEDGSIPRACLQSEAELPRYKNLRTRLREAITDHRELSDGYSFRLNGELISLRQHSGSAWSAIAVRSSHSNCKRQGASATTVPGFRGDRDTFK
jgi:hypothetical protein